MGKMYENEQWSRNVRPPRAVEVPDLAFPEALEVLGAAAATHCRLVAAYADDDTADEIGAFGEAVRASASAGLLDASVACDALLSIIEVICLKGEGPLAEFFEESTAKGAEMLRAQVPTKTIWRSEVDYPDYRSELDGLQDLNQDDVEQVVLTAEMIHRLGCMAANLEQRPYVVEFEGHPQLIEQWTVSAAISGFLHGGDDDVAASDMGALVALPVVVITQILTWLDTKVLPGLSRSVIDFVRNELVPQMMLGVMEQAPDPAVDPELGEAA